MKDIEITELINSYLKYNNLKIINRNNNNAELFLPFLLIDAQYSLSIEHVAKLDLKFSEKRYRNLWFNATNSFNKQFFNAFDSNQQALIVDVMDSFISHISNSVMLLKVATMNRFMDYDSELRTILSDTLACNILAQSAQFVYKRIHQGESSLIKSIENNSELFLTTYGNGKVNKCDKESLSSFKPLIDAVNQLIKNISNFKI